MAQEETIETVGELIKALTDYLELDDKAKFEGNPDLSLLARSVLARDRGEALLEGLAANGGNVTRLAEDWGVSRYQMQTLKKQALARRAADEVEGR